MGMCHTYVQECMQAQINNAEAQINNNIQKTPKKHIPKCIFQLNNMLAIDKYICDCVNTSKHHVHCTVREELQAGIKLTPHAPGVLCHPAALQLIESEVYGVQV